MKSESCSVVSDSLWPRGLYSPWTSPGQNTGVGSLFFLQGNLPNPGIKPRSPALQVNSLPAEPPRKPKNTGAGSLSLLQQIFLTGVELESPSQQVDSLPAELPGKSWRWKPLVNFSTLKHYYMTLVSKCSSSFRIQACMLLLVAKNIENKNTGVLKYVDLFKCVFK